MRHAGPALLLALLTTGGAALAAPLSALEQQAGDCLQAVEANAGDPAVPACEAFAAAFQASPRWGGHAIPDTTSALHDVMAAEREFATAASSRPALQTASVAAILRQVAAEQRPKAAQGWWQRFLDWLDQLLRERPQQQAAWPQWLVDWLKAIPGIAVERIFWGLVSVLAALLLWVLWRELAESGLLQRSRPRSERKPATESAALDATPPLDATALRRLSPHEQPAAVLRWVIARLAAQDLLRGERSLTNQQLHQQLLQRAPAIAADFLHLSRIVERALYGGESLDGAARSALLEQATQLATGTAVAA